MRAILFLMMMIGFGLTACNEGPAEEFGEDVDEAAENTGDAFQDAADDIDDNF
ncbi:MAG: hypothetical protein WDZ76_10220 [Pseudohongiellaceae bacterium]